MHIRQLTHLTDDQCQALAQVLVACVDAGASVSFMAPLALKTAVAFWQGVGRRVAREECLLLVAEDADGQLIGTVQAIIEQPENQPHRADVAKLLVHPDLRRRGVARALMAELERAAVRAGKWLLVLDTASGGEAQRLYERLGWQRVGEIPHYALWPEGGWCGTTLYYKRLGAGPAVYA